MGRLENGSALMNGPESQHFRNWLKVAASTTARTVITAGPAELALPDHDRRLRLALEVAVVPDIVVDRLVTWVATDPQVADSVPVFNDASEVVVQNKVDGLWSKLAEVMYP
jgi:hypothetical protein